MFRFAVLFFVWYLWLLLISGRGWPHRMNLTEFLHVQLFWKSFRKVGVNSSLNARCVYIYNWYTSFLYWSLDHYDLTFLASCYNFYFKVYFVWYGNCFSSFLLFLFMWNIYLFHSLTFSLYVSVGLKWVSFRLYIYGFCFCIFSASLSQLVKAFNSFTFEVIINIYVPFLNWFWFVDLLYFLVLLFSSGSNLEKFI